MHHESEGKAKKQAIQTMYILEGGLLMVSNLLQTHSWVNNDLRTHCSVCIQQFQPFRRRHHCRTCGEVVCAGCSSQHTVRLTDINVECETRVCTFCIIRATDASNKANEAATSENSQDIIPAVSILSLESPLNRRHKQFSANLEHVHESKGSHPKAVHEIANLNEAGKSRTRSTKVDPTMKLLVSVVARTLKCPGAFIGVTDDTFLCIKASMGIDDNVTHIPKDGCLSPNILLQKSTVIVDPCTDTCFHKGGLACGNRSLRFYAGTPICVRGHLMGVVCAFDTKPHSHPTGSMISTLEAVASIVSEVLEHRVAADCTTAQAREIAGFSYRPQTNSDNAASFFDLKLLPSSQHTVSIIQGHDYDATRQSLNVANQHAGKIIATIDYFFQLQKSAWIELTILPELSINGTIQSFELFRSGKRFTRSVMMVAADCSSVVTELLDYNNAFLYQHLFSHVSNRRELSGQTWVDCVTLHPSYRATRYNSFQIVTHHREHRGGGNMVVATGIFEDNSSESGFIFGWFVAPSEHGNERSTANVSCITAQQIQNQTQDLNLSLDLLRRINQKLTMTQFFHLPGVKKTFSKPSAVQNQKRSVNQRRQYETTLIDSCDNVLGGTSDQKEATTTTTNSNRNTDFSGGNRAGKLLVERNCTALVPLRETPPANQDEQLLLDLLDKTISTQQILAERQHKMADLTNAHSNQLECISSALSRAEYILIDQEATRALKGSTGMLVLPRRGWTRARLYTLALRRCFLLPWDAIATSRCHLSTISTSDSHKLPNCREFGSFDALARIFSSIEEVKSSRLESVLRLADGYRDLLALPMPQALASALHLTASQLAPPYDGVELRFGAQSFKRLLKQLLAEQWTELETNQTLETFLASYSDYGLATQALLDSGRIVVPEHDDRGQPLSIQTVHDQLMAIATDEGLGGAARKQQLALKLLQQCRCPEERIFIVRMLAHQNLRIGMGEKSILSALALASFPSNVDDLASRGKTEWIDCITVAYAQHPNYHKLAELVHVSQHEKDIVQRMAWLYDEAHPTSGVPVLTMSAYPESSVSSVLNRVRKTLSRTATCEYKYDGARLQVHLTLPNSSVQSGSVGRIFSRNMEDVTERYSSLLHVLERRLKARDAALQSLSHVTSFIVEGEVVAIDRTTGTFLPFQMLQTKTTTEFCLFLFDLLAIDHTNLLQKPLRERRRLLQNLVDEELGHLEFVKYVDIDMTHEAVPVDGNKNNEALAMRDVLERAVASGCEGLMIKILDGEESVYRAGRRSYSWMKLKRDYLSNETPTSTRTENKSAAATTSGNGTFLADTLDLVPIGVFHGKGRRAGVFGSFLMATYNTTSEKFETIGKVGSGFSDAQLSEISIRFRKRILPKLDRVPEQYQSLAVRSQHPDFWLSPEEVWEIKATQLTESSSYTCGANVSSEKTVDPTPFLPQKGLALRFPRFVRYRSDKNPLQATSSEQARKLFEQQQ
ncbi:putative FYVE zinc finger, DNA ligase, ATP-dependent, Zinc finger, FYVE/PHD-type [Plasmopara halstedii]